MIGGGSVALHLPHCSWCLKNLKSPYQDYKGDIVDVPVDEQERSVMFLGSAHIGAPGERVLKSVSMCLCTECQKEFGLEEFAKFLQKLTDDSRKQMSRREGLDGGYEGNQSGLIVPGDPRVRQAIGERGVHVPGIGATSD